MNSQRRAPYPRARRRPRPAPADPVDASQPASAPADPVDASPPASAPAEAGQVETGPAPAGSPEHDDFPTDVLEAFRESPGETTEVFDRVDDEPRAHVGEEADTATAVFPRIVDDGDERHTELIPVLPPEGAEYEPEQPESELERQEHIEPDAVVASEAPASEAPASVPPESEAPGFEAPASEAPGSETPEPEDGVPVDVAPGRRKRVWPKRVAALVLVLTVTGAAGGGAWYAWTQAEQLREESTVSNVALIDPAATAEVAKQVSTAIEAIYSYDSADLNASEARAQSYITGSFREEFAQLFAQVRQLAPEQQAVLNSTVLEVGVKTLTDRRANLLLMVEQNGTRGANREPVNASVRLSVTAQRVDGQWKVSSVRQR